MKDSFINKYGKIILSSLVFILMLVPIMTKVKPETKKENKLTLIGDDKTYKHVSNEIIKEETVEGVKFTNIVLLTNKGQTTFTADATNTTSNGIKKDNYKIELLDKKGKVLITLGASIPGGLKKGETKKITSVARGEFKEVVAKKIKK